jgi:hypothetical protein
MKGCVSDGSYSPDYSLTAVDLKSFKNNLVDIIQQNKERWKELAAQGKVVSDAFCPDSILTPLIIWIFFHSSFFFYKICKLLVVFGIWLYFGYL